MKTEDLKPWGDDVALAGPDAPKNNGMIEHLIGYLLTVHERFGNTAVTASIKWGANALWKRDEQAERFAAHTAAVQAFLIELEETMGVTLPADCVIADALPLILKAARENRQGLADLMGRKVDPDVLAYARAALAGDASPRADASNTGRMARELIRLAGG